MKTFRINFDNGFSNVIDGEVLCQDENEYRILGEYFSPVFICPKSFIKNIVELKDEDSFLIRSLNPEFLDLLQTNVIQAIKMYRGITGCGLKEAKNYCDNLKAKLGIYPFNKE